MSSNDTNLGLGRAAGMFFHAPAGTPLPTYPTEFVGATGDGTESENFTATAAQTSFTLTSAPGSAGIKSLTIDGAEQEESSTSGYSWTSGTTVNWNGAALAGGEKVVITYYTSAWKEVGDVSSDGLTMATDKTTENLKNWANAIKRLMLSEHVETIQAPIMDTTESTLKVVVGEKNVTVTPATATHGKLIDVNLSSSELPPAEAFLFLMVDGDDTMAIGMTNGQIQAVDNVSFAPGSAIIWTPTISVLENSLHFIKDDGQVIA
jgi:hypothetical protein